MHKKNIKIICIILLLLAIFNIMYVFFFLNTNSKCDKINIDIDDNCDCKKEHMNNVYKNENENKNENKIKNKKKNKNENIKYDYEVNAMQYNPCSVECCGYDEYHNMTIKNPKINKNIFANSNILCSNSENNSGCLCLTKKNISTLNHSLSNSDN
jgi:hypothetical protein